MISLQRLDGLHVEQFCVDEVRGADVVPRASRLVQLTVNGYIRGDDVEVEEAEGAFGCLRDLGLSAANCNLFGRFFRDHDPWVEVGHVLDDSSGH